MTTNPTSGPDARAHEQFAENADPRFKVFVGPCAHGRDPFTRCDICGDMSAEDAKALAEEEARNG